MNKYQTRVFKSLTLFLILLMLGIMSIFCGFALIGLAETTTISEMNYNDMFFTFSGSVLVFASFFWVSCMSLVSRIK
jgi:hypothetical protein